MPATPKDPNCRHRVPAAPSERPPEEGWARAAVVRWVLPAVWEAGNGNPECVCGTAWKPRVPLGRRPVASTVFPTYSQLSQQRKLRLRQDATVGRYQPQASFPNPGACCWATPWPFGPRLPFTRTQPFSASCPLPSADTTALDARPAGPAGKMALAPANLSPVCPRFKHGTSFDPHNGPSQEALPTLFFRWEAGSGRVNNWL